MLDLDRERPFEPLGAADEPLQDELAGTTGMARICVRERAGRAPRALGGFLGRLARFERPLREVFGLEAQPGELARHCVSGAAPGPALGCERANIRLGHRPAKLRLAGGDPVQVTGQAARPLGERSLEAAGSGCHNPQGLIEPFGAVRDAGEPRGVGSTHVAQMGDRREPLGGCAGLFGGLLAAGRRLGGAGCKLLHLAAQLAAARVELEENGLRGLARKPELAVLRVPADPFCGHCRDLRGEQFVERQHGHVHELARVAADEYQHRPEAGRVRLLDQLERPGGMRCEHCRSAMSERGGRRALGTRLDLELLERKLLTFLGERACGRRKPFALRKRLLEREEAFPREADASLEIFLFPQRRAGGGIGVVRQAAEVGGRRAARDAARVGQLRLQLREQTLCGLVADAERLCCPAEGEQSVAPAAGEL